MLRWMTAGESHGPALVAVLDGMPAGVALTTDDLRAALARRRLGYGRGARMSFETDELEVVGGLRHGCTLGSPLAVRIGNAEWPKWEAVMAADPVPDEALRRATGTGDEKEVARNRPLTRPRPGHADLAGMEKYGFADARPVLERASARETAARVALGEAARQLLAQALGAHIVSHVVALGGVAVPEGCAVPDPAGRGVRDAVDADPVRCAHPATSAAMVQRVDDARRDGDTLGGVVEVVVSGLVPGLGSHVQWDRRLDARLAAALMSIQAIKAVEIGDGMAGAHRPGSAAHDEMSWQGEGRRVVRRATGRSGGVEGGMSTGELLRVRAAMKPISTVPRALATVDVATGEPATAIHQRSDVCAVPAAGVVAEAMVALVLAEALLEKFGGDHLRDVQAAVRHYRDDLATGRIGQPVHLELPRDEEDPS